MYVKKREVSDVGLRLTQLRERKGKSQDEVAAEIEGATQTLISRHERGFNEPTSIWLERYAAYYGVTVDYLLGRERAGAPTTDEPHIQETEPAYQTTPDPQGGLVLTLDDISIRFPRYLKEEILLVAAKRDLTFREVLTRAIRIGLDNIQQEQNS